VKLAPKIALIGFLVVSLIMGATGYFVVSSLNKDMRANLASRQAGDLQFAIARIKQQADYVSDITRVVARIRDIPRALDTYESRGINQILNDQIEIYPFINYILVLENDGSIFAVSTRDNHGGKTKGEQLLLLQADEHPLYSVSEEALKGSNINISSVNQDPYLDIVDLEKGQFSQWYRAAIYKRGKAIGQVVVSIDWSQVQGGLLDDIVHELQNTGNPIKFVTISKLGSTHILAKNNRLKGTDIAHQNASIAPNMNGADSAVEDLLLSKALTVGKFDYKVSVSYDKALALKPITSAIEFVGIATVLGSFLLGTFFFLTIRKIILSRLIVLSRSMVKIGQGDLAYKIPGLGDDEIAGVGQAINLMVENLYTKTISVDRLNEEIVLRKQALLELNEQQFALDQHAIVAATDIKGTITHVNDRFCDISGYDRDELLGENHRILKSDYHDEAFFRQMFLTISQGKVWRGEICNKAKSGKRYWVDTTIVPFLGEDLKPRSYIAIRTDITLTKQAEKSMEKAKFAAEDSARAKSEFLANMSHEIRTPMNGVMGMLGLLSRTSLDESQKRQVILAKTSADSLLALINDILDFSKIEAGKLEIENVDFNLRKMFDSFSESQGLKASEQKVELIVDTSEIKVSSVRGDPSRLRQILNNLVGNAFKFTEQGEIMIRASLDKQGKLYCQISDTGIGIPEGKRATLFDSFTQADTSTTRKYGGTGLGLSITKQLCKLMGGRIFVSSELGEGSCFSFEVQLEPTVQSKAVLPEMDISNLNILIVDDNFTNREVLRGQLSLWGAKVQEAENAHVALNLLAQSFRPDSSAPIELAILDMQMPGMDGAELGKRIRADQRFDSVKLVMMTSMSEMGDARFFADLGFQAYFPKPVTTDDLFKALSVMSEDGEALQQAQPLVTSHYLKELNVMGDEAEASKEFSEFTRILLVEDNSINQLVAQSILGEFGLNADIAANGIEALDMLKMMEHKAPYHLVFMDCQMPEMDGYQATQAIRQGQVGEAMQAIPIIAMTANAMKGDKEHCLSVGMDDYLSKPIIPEDLESKLHKWLPDVNDDIILPINLWDHETLLKRLGGNQPLLLKIAGLFLVDAKNQIDKVELALQEEDYESIRHYAHTLKGESANLCAVSFSDLMFELENAARNEDKNILALMVRINAEWAELSIYIDNFLRSHEQA